MGVSHARISARGQPIYAHTYPPIDRMVTGLSTLRECYNVIHIQFEISRNPIGQVSRTKLIYIGIENVHGESKIESIDSSMILILSSTSTVRVVQI
jgi:hypothetical protein